MKIIRDTRERNGWNFFFHGAKFVSEKLDAGDYTTDILRDIVAIERKASVVEIANNLGKKEAKARFHREFERAKTLEKIYIVCEFSESDVYAFPKGAGLRPKQLASIRMNGGYLHKLLEEIETMYPNVELVFCDNRESAEDFTYETLREWESKYV